METSLGQPSTLEAASKEDQWSGLGGGGVGSWVGRGRQKHLQNLKRLAGLLPSLSGVTVELGSILDPKREDPASHPAVYALGPNSCPARSPSQALHWVHCTGLGGHRAAVWPVNHPHPRSVNPKGQSVLRPLQGCPWPASPSSCFRVRCSSARTSQFWYKFRRQCSSRSCLQRADRPGPYPAACPAHGCTQSQGRARGEPGQRSPWAGPWARL